MSDSEINIDEKGQLRIRIDLNTINNAKVLTYGTLKVAEEEASRWFIMKELKARQMREKMGIITPGGNGSERH